MITEPQQMPRQDESAAPSRDFIQAISEFFDTDPADLLVELGYYNREESDSQELPTSQSA